MRESIMGNVENHRNVANQTIINIQNMAGNIGGPCFVIPAQVLTTDGMTGTRFALNADYYNLFVIGNETFSDGHFIVPKERALTESITIENKAIFSCLTEDAIAQIKTFPSLFASKNHQYGKTDGDHNAIFGLVTDVRIQDNGVKIRFHQLWPVPQQKLNEATHRIALDSAASFNELNRTHWTIKQVNLLEELKAAGISILAPT
jgi:hypothetical protein